jgi:hypothetical protein
MHPITSILIVGTKIEGILCCILSIFWVATVSVVTDSRHGLAVDESGAVSNGNLYYFSWYVMYPFPDACISLVTHSAFIIFVGLASFVVSRYSYLTFVMCSM